MAFCASSRRLPAATRQSASNTITTSGGLDARCSRPNARAYPFPRRSGSRRSTTSTDGIVRAREAVASVQLSAMTRRRSCGPSSHQRPQGVADTSGLVVSGHEDREPTPRGWPSASRAASPCLRLGNSESRHSSTKIGLGIASAIARIRAADPRPDHPRRPRKGPPGLRRSDRYRAAARRCLRPSRPIRASSSGAVVNTDRRAVTRSSIDPAGTSQPDLPASTSSGMPATKVLSTGRDSAKASMMATGRPSAKLGNTSAPGLENVPSDLLAVGPARDPDALAQPMPRDQVLDRLAYSPSPTSTISKSRPERARMAAASTSRIWPLASHSRPRRPRGAPPAAPPARPSDNLRPPRIARCGPSAIR